MKIFVSRTKPAHVVPLRFVRAPGDHVIDAERPEVDDRGHSGEHPGAYLPVAEGSTSKVGVTRFMMPTSQTLVATVPHASASIIELVGNTTIGSDAVTTISVKGKRQTGRHPARSRRGEIHFHLDSAQGKVVGKLNVVAYHPKHVKLMLHLVQFRATDGTEDTACALDMTGITEAARKVWAPYGVVFDVNRPAGFALADLYGGASVAMPGGTGGSPAPASHGVTEKLTIPPPLTTGSEAGKYFIDGSPAGLRGPLSEIAVADHINVYFIKRMLNFFIRDSSRAITGADWFGGLGISRQQAAALHLPMPGIFVCEDWGGGYRPENDVLSRALAHEVGHFMGVGHGRETNALDGSASRYIGADSSTYGLRLLMHPRDPTMGRDTWTQPPNIPVPAGVTQASNEWAGRYNYASRPRDDDRGYGTASVPNGSGGTQTGGRCGVLVTQKAAPGTNADDQVGVALRTLDRPNEVY